MKAVEIQLLVLYAIEAYRNVLVVRIILSLVTAFVPVSFPPALRPALNFLYDVSEPFLRLFRRLLPPVGMIDFSPMIGFLVLYILELALQRVFFST